MIRGGEFLQNEVIDLFGFIESSTFWSAVFGVLSTLTAAWLSYFLTKRSAKFAFQTEAIVSAVQAVSDARHEIDEIQDEFFRNAMTADTFDATIKTSQAIYDSLTNELYLLAAKANDKKLYALVYCAQHAITKAVDSGVASFRDEGAEAAAEDIRYNLADELDDLREKLTSYLNNLRFHRSAVRKYGKNCDTPIAKESQDDEEEL